MIVDAHTHVLYGPWVPDWFINWLNNLEARIYNLSVAEIAAERPKSWDPSGDLMVENLNHAGIDKAVVCVSDLGFMEHSQDAATTIEEINRQTYEMVQRHPDRLYLSAGVDPRRKNAIEISEMAAREWGAKTLKLQPTTGWYPNDKMFYPLYQKCSELGLPLDFHTGPQPYPMKSRCGNPQYIEAVAEDFPELTIQCTHAGDMLFMELLAVAKGHQNVVIDIAFWQRWLFSSRSTSITFWQTLRFMMDMIGPRVMLGSDWDCKVDDSEYIKWVQPFREIPSYVKEAGIEFTQPEMDNFLGSTAIKYLIRES